MFARFMKIALVALMVLALPHAALAAATPQQAEKVASKMLDLTKVVDAIQTQIDATLTSMNDLAKPEGDLVAKYKTFSANVDKLDKGAQKAKSAAESAASKREQYLKEWQASQGQIQNEQLKSASEARRAELMPKIEAIKTSLGSARDTYTPFMQDLKDLKVFLGTQLNPGGVAAAAALFEKCNSAGEKVKSDLVAGNVAIKDLASSIAPSAAKK